eukprot:6459904-Amphidinium_carterae.1
MFWTGMTYLGIVRWYLPNLGCGNPGGNTASKETSSLRPFQCLTVVVLQANGHVLIVNPDTGISRSLVEYRQAHTPCTYGLQFLGVASPQELDIFLLENAHSGSRVLYDLSALYKLVLGDSATMAPARWYFSWWPHWEKMLLLHRVPSGHLRKAAVVGGKAADAVDDEIRFLKVPTVSTHCLLLFLSRWGADSKSSRKKDDSARQSWRVCLMSLLKRWFPQGSSCFLKLAADTASSAAPGCDGSKAEASWPKLLGGA